MWRKGLTFRSDSFLSDFIIFLFVNLYHLLIFYSFMYSTFIELL